jgi:superkiller protein 3
MRTVIVLLLVLTLAVPASARLTYKALVTSARIYLGQVPTDFENAQARLEEAIEKFQDKQPLEAYMLLGALYAEKGRFKEMGENFDAALAICADPQDKKVKKRCEKENVLENIGNIRLSEWIEQFNEGAQILGDTRDMETELEELETELKEAIEGGDTEEDEIADLRDETEGLEEEIQVYYRDALSLFVNATDISPDSADGWINMGISYYNLGIKDSAILAYKKAAEYHPDNFDLLSNMAAIYFELQDWNACEKTFSRMATLEPDNIGVLKNHAMILRQLEMKDSARVMMDKVLELDSNDTEIRRQRGFDEVIKGADVNKIMLDLRYEDEKAHAAEIDSLIQLRNDAYSQVIEDFTVVTANDPSDFDAWYYLGLSHRLLEQDVEAISAFEHAVEVNPEDADIWEQLAVLYLKIGERQKSDKALKTANELKSDDN